jgi:hypothetical protein
MMRPRPVLWSLIPLVLVSAACRRTHDAGQLTELQRARSGTLAVVLLSPTGALHHGRDTFAIEFRSASDGTLVDVGAVKVTAMMPMGGTPMFGRIDVAKTDVPGRYLGRSDLSMSGMWRTTVEWNGPSGQGSVNLPATVQ